MKVSRSAPPPKKPVGYANVILQSDRVVETAKRMPGETNVQIGRAIGLSANWAGELLRIAKLPELIKEYVRRQGPYVRRSQITAIDVRRLALLRDGKEQIRRFEEILKARRLPPLSTRAAE